MKTDCDWPPKRILRPRKIAAINGRGTKKDFIDLFFLLKVFPLHEIISFYLAKVADGFEFMAMKSIAYFEDAESDPMPNMLIPVSWESVKKYIIELQKKY